ncbi:MAG TPA: biotin/lipoate A/B protein ligase family protein [Candidatus Bathyarchaeia archaeon]|nr:biotin/lipoate A/B protein ligase family protein [Candidatus Bathyarchaeia archaeon]
MSLEADTNLCKKHGIAIVRRFTGGGAVYHDEGNLNFTILNRRQNESLATLHEINSSYIITALKNMGLQSECAAPNSVHLDGRKISGAACALNSHYALWHASVLVSTNTTILRQVLSPSREAIQSKFVRSKWRPVTTLNEHLSKPVNVEEFSLQLTRSIRQLTGGDIEPGRLSETEEEMSRALYDRKYGTTLWNLYGKVGNVGNG